MSRVLVVSADVVGERMAGPGIRSWEFSRRLSRTNDTVLAAPPPLPADAPGFQVIESRPSIIDRVIDGFDVAIVQGYALSEVKALARARHLVVDLYDPFVLENLEVHESQPPDVRELIHEQDLMILRRQLLQGDFFMCASERQRHFWMGMLTIANRVNPSTYADDRSLRRLIEVVPFGLPPEPPQKTGPGLRDGKRIGSDDIVVLWGGGIWNWFDPLTLIQGMQAAVQRCPQLKLVFMGTQHPNPSIPKMRMLNRAHELADRLGLTDRHVFFRPGWTPYAERKNILADADIGVSLHFEHIETVYAFRTRVLDYLWAGLPMVLTRGDEMAEIAVAEGLGMVVDYEDVAGVEQALVTLATDAAMRRQCRARVEAVRKRFEWPTVARPLERYCDAPWTAPDRDPRKQDLQRIGRRWFPLRMLARKAWASYTNEGASALLHRAYRYARRRL